MSFKAPEINTYPSLLILSVLRMGKEACLEELETFCPADLVVKAPFQNLDSQLLFAVVKCHLKSLAPAFLKRVVEWAGSHFLFLF